MLINLAGTPGVKTYTLLGSDEEYALTKGFMLGCGVHDGSDLVAK